MIKKMVAARRASQVLFLGLFVYILWSTTYPLSGALPSALFFNLDPLLVIMTSVSERIVIPGLIASLCMLALTLTLGRFFCGWICPLGFSIDMAGVFKRWRRALSESDIRAFRKVKYCILAVIAAAAVGGWQIAWIFDPIALMARFISLNLIPAATAMLNTVFIFLIRDLHFSGAFLDLYRSLKPTILGVKIYYFPHASAILLYFLISVGSALSIRRLWCRGLCPLGALYALAGRYSPLHRTVRGCKQCGKCARECRTAAIKKDGDYVKGECILCMDCIYTSPLCDVSFGFSRRDRGSSYKSPANPDAGGILRKDFIVMAVSSLASLPVIAGFKDPAERPDNPKDSAAYPDGLIRPPAALLEKDFNGRCVRCGNCMKVCVTNGLQPAVSEAGYCGIWTPHLVPEIGYCEYKCTLCGNTCPTGAIPPITLERKLKVKLGVAEIDKKTCIPWAEGKDCIVCEEHCPVSEKAILFEIDAKTGAKKPRIEEKLCVGCGICVTKCPVRPVRAVKISSRNSERTRC